MAPRRLGIGADVRLLVGALGFATVTGTTVTASGTDFLIVPMGFIGYEAF